ncbi:MAG: hypothetical protein OHK0045_20370 [Raineya sp.]
MAFGQKKCGSYEYEMELRAKYPSMGTVEQFEQWMAQKIAERRNNPAARTGPYKIPVIIHVIYQNSNAAIANGSENIPYGQAISQIRVLNEDYQRTNADAVNTRAIFVPRAGSMPDLEFVAATKDPNGNVLAEPGVRRINGQTTFGRTSWDQSSCNSILKPATIWDPERYLNIWVVNLGTSLFGYAQFPEGSGLPGMPGGAQTSNTDGVVLNYRSTGSNYNPDGTPVSGGPYILSPLSPGTDRGRTATHEIGHWLGLRHSWGDGDCSVDDFCADTPWQGGDSPLTTNCPSSHTRNTCTTIDTPYGVDANDQIENYMDYSADVCMNMFTLDQVNRMYVVLEDSPRRNTLTAAAATVAAPILTGAYAAITPSRTNIIEGEQVNFVGAGRMGDNEVPNTITSWSWNFDVDGIGGVSPATFSGQNPGNVTFNRVGNYKVRLTVSNGTTSGFTEVTIVSGLKAPTSLQYPDAQGSGTNAKVIDQTRMTWNDNSNSEDNYLVERKKSFDPPSAFATIATLPANSNTYTDNFATASPAIESGTTYTYRITAVKGSATASVSRNIILERVTALDETPLAREVRIYPNPAQSSFRVDLSALQINTAKLQLHNALGQMVAQKAINTNEASFEVQNLPKGMYLLKIETDKGVGVKRILIQ